MIKIPFNEKEYKKHEEALRVDLLAKAAIHGLTPEEFIEKIVEKEIIKEVPIEVIKEVIVEKIVEVDNPNHLKQLAQYEIDRAEKIEAYEKLYTENAHAIEKIGLLEKLNSKLKEALDELTTQ